MSRHRIASRTTSQAARVASGLLVTLSTIVALGACKGDHIGCKEIGAGSCVCGDKVDDDGFACNSSAYGGSVCCADSGFPGDHSADCYCTEGDHACGTGETQVDSCQAASTSSSSTQNVCPQGPGRCANGDSSTCNCGTSCVQTSTCTGCDYECVKGCATDADCDGFFSGDTPPAPLKCIGASSTMPTAHCGL